MQHQPLRVRFSAHVFPIAGLCALVHRIKADAAADPDTPGKIQRFHGDALISPFPVHHIHKSPEAKLQLLSRCCSPDKTACQHAGPQVQLPPEIPEGHLPQVQLFTLQHNLGLQPVCRRHHEVSPVNDALIGFRQGYLVVYAVHIGAPQGIHAPAFIKAAPHAHALISQAENRFAHPGVGRVKPLLCHFPGVHGKIYVRRLCHTGAPPSSFNTDRYRILG